MVVGSGVGYDSRIGGGAAVSGAGAAAQPESPCPCGRAAYGECCGPLHSGAPAPTAERLMRSRYSAFALRLGDYLLTSWHPSTRPNSLSLEDDIVWRRLLIESTEAGGPFDSEGRVTFTAIARTPEGRLEQRERSRFMREGRHWRYLDGEAPA